MKRNRLHGIWVPLLWLSWISLTGCFKTPSERNNPFDPAVNADPFQLEAQPYYGQICLKWNTPAKTANLAFNIYRKELPSGTFLLLNKTTVTAFADTAIFKYGPANKFVYRISAVSPNGESEPSQPDTAYAHLIPKMSARVFDPGRFFKGIQSRQNSNWLYVLVEQKARIRTFDVSSGFDLIDSRNYDKSVKDFSIARLGRKEYILALSDKDTTLNVREIDGGSQTDLPSIKLPYPAATLTCSSDDDSCVFVALRQSQSVYLLVKINYLNLRQRWPSAPLRNSILFMIFKRDLSRLLVLSPNNMYMLDKALTTLCATEIGGSPINISFAPNLQARSNLVFVCCYDARQIVPLQIDGNSCQKLEPFNLGPYTANEKFVWAEVSAGAEKDALIFNLVYDQSQQAYRVEKYRTADGKSIDKECLLRPLQLPENEIGQSIRTMTYILPPAAEKLGLFARDKIFYFYP